MIDMKVQTSLYTPYGVNRPGGTDPAAGAQAPQAVRQVNGVEPLESTVRRTSETAEISPEARERYRASLQGPAQQQPAPTPVRVNPQTMSTLPPGGLLA